MFQAFRVLLLFTLFFVGSHHCKRFLDNNPVLDPQGIAVSSPSAQAMLRTLLFNRKIAISRFYQLQMMTTFNNFPDGKERKGRGALRAHDDHDHPHHHDDDDEDDSVDENKHEIVTRYMHRNSLEFFNFDRYYQLIELSLESDPQNVLVQEWAMHLVHSREMVERTIQVFETIFKNHPDWRYAFQIGWLHLYYLKDYTAAGTWLERAQEFTEAPPFVNGILQAAYALATRYENSIRMILEQMKQTRDETSWRRLNDRLRWFQGLDTLSKKGSAFREQSGRYPESLDELIASGFLQSIPEDPVGDGYYWNTIRNEPDSLNNPFERVRDDPRIPT